MEILVFEELRESKIKVGILHKDKNHYVFNYDPDYLNKPLATALGADLPLGLDVIRSKFFFKSLQDLLPDKHNPAYATYCHQAGILPSEADPLKLLVSVGKRGASKFVFEERREEFLLTAKEIVDFRKKLRLSQRDLSLLFDIPLISLQQLEKKDQGQKITRRFLKLVMQNERLLNKQIKQRGYLLHSKKLGAILMSRQKKSVADYFVKTLLQRAFISTEIKQLQSLRRHVDEKRAFFKDDLFQSIINLEFNYCVIIAGIMNDLLEELTGLLYFDIPLTIEMERFSEDYEKYLKKMRNFLVHGYGYSVKNFDLAKGIGDNDFKKQIEEMIKEVHDYLVKTGADDFLLIMEKIVNQLSSIAEQLKKKIIARQSTEIPIGLTHS